MRGWVDELEVCDTEQGANLPKDHDLVFSGASSTQTPFNFVLEGQPGFIS